MTCPTTILTAEPASRSSPGPRPDPRPGSTPAKISPEQLAAMPDLFRDEAFMIETRRLWLRWPKSADAPALQRFAGLREVAEMTATWPHPLPPLEAETRILKARQINADGRGLIMAIVRKKEPGRQIGTIGFAVEDASALGIGYMLDPARHNRGFVTEAVREFCAAAFLFSACQRIVGDCRIDNPASRRVFEKCGFDCVGQGMRAAPARAQPLHCLDYALSREAWLAQTNVR